MSLVNDLRRPVTIPDDDYVGARLKTLDGGGHAVHADGPESQLTVGPGLEGTAALEAEMAAFR